MLLIVVILLSGLFFVVVNSPTVGSQTGRANNDRVLADGRYFNQPISYTVNGDSLQVVSKDYFLQTRPNWRPVSFSAKGGRRAPKALAILRSQQLGQVVFVSVGTNDWFRPIGEFDQALGKIVNLVGPNRCLVMATIYDHGSIEAINKHLRLLAKELGPARMQLVDWANVVESGKIRLADNVHPGTRRDHRYRTQLLVKAAENCLAARNEI